MGRRPVTPATSRHAGTKRPAARALTLSAAAAGVAAGIALQRRHQRSIANDPDYELLTAPLGGRPQRVRSADGSELHVEVFGRDDGPTMVLAHGWTEQLRFWGPVIRILRERGLRPVAYDLRGHGRSDPAAGGDYSLDRFGDDVEAVLAATTPAGELATIVGHSLGAMSIAAWAQDHDVRTRARAVVMVNTGLGNLVTDQLLLSGLAPRLATPAAGRAVLGSQARVPTFSSPLVHSVIHFVAFGPTATIGQIAFYERMLIECSPDVRAAVGIAMANMDLWEAVAKLTVPTLVVAGDRDRLTPPGHSRRIAAALPEPAGLIELRRTGHMAPLERPAELADAVSGLVRATAAKSMPAAAR